MDAQAAELKATMAGIRDAKLKNQLQSKDKSELPKLPKLGGMQYSDEGRIMRQRAAAARAKLREESLGNAGSKTKDIFKKVHKERLEAAKLRNMFKPNHTLNHLASRVTTAPRSMVEDYHRSTAPKSVQPLPMMRATLGVSRSSQRRATPDKVEVMSGPTMEAREKRLLALTNPDLIVEGSSDLLPRPNAEPSRSLRDLRSSLLSAYQDKPSISSSAPTKTAAASLQVSSTPKASLSKSSSGSAASASELTPTLAKTRKTPFLKRISPVPRSGPPTMKKKAQADVFLPAKRRRFS